MKKILYNLHENRLRTGWRILIFIIAFWCLSASSFIIKPLLGEISKKEFLENYSIIIVAILAISASISVSLARKFLDKHSLVSLGLHLNRTTFKDLVFGFFLSALMAGLFFIIVLISGLIEFNGFYSNKNFELTVSSSDFVRFMSIVSIGSFFILLFETVLVGYWEELVFRGYLLQNMIDGMGIKIAIGISCILYGLIHAMNPNAGILSSSIIVLFGFLRVYGYLATYMLWLSIGMHIGWNFFQGPVFGFGASGHKKISVLDLTVTGPEWLSGGEFGPEGSIIIIPIIILAIYVMYIWTRGRRINSN